MTGNQVNYWKNEETRRSNLEQEKLKTRDQALKQQDLKQQEWKNRMDAQLHDIENKMKWGYMGSLEANTGTENLLGFGGGPKADSWGSALSAVDMAKRWVDASPVSFRFGTKI